MTNERFSIREGFATPSGNLVWHDAPQNLRDKFIPVVRDYARVPPVVVDRAVARACLIGIIQTSRIRRRGDPDEWAQLRPRLLQCQWFEFYNACEFVYEELVSYQLQHSPPAVYESRLNDLFASQGIGWRMKAGRLERSISPLVDEEIQKATALLGDKRFVAPAMQLQKAIRFLSQRLDPDTGNCVNEALGAVEGVVRIILKDDDALLSRALRVEPFASAIHPRLREAIEKAYAYRGAVTAHGQIVTPSPASVEDAEFVLGLCASTITYLIRKFGSST